MLTCDTEQASMDNGVRSLPPKMALRSHDGEGRPLDENLCLENLTHGFVRPCILDLKLGFRLYESHADASKRDKMIANAKGTTTESLGLRISGMKVHDSCDDRCTIYPKRFGRTRTNDTILDAFLAFFFPTTAYGHSSDPHIVRVDDASDGIRKETTRGNISSKKMRWIIESYMDDLRDIRQFIADHPTIQLIGTSLLFVYEGDLSAANRVWAQMLQEDQDITVKGNGDAHIAHTNNEKGSDDESDSGEEQRPRLCDLRIIDFAHSRWDAQQTEIDNDLLRAIDNVLDLLNQCLEKQRCEKL